MNASKLPSLLLTLAVTVTTATLSLTSPALAKGNYGVKVECHSEKCFGVIIDLDTGEAVNVTEPQKNERRAYRKARKRLEETQSQGYNTSDEWLRCHLDPQACELGL